MKRNIRDLKPGDKLKFGTNCNLDWLLAGQTYTINRVIESPYMVTIDMGGYERYLSVGSLNRYKAKLVK